MHEQDIPLLPECYMLVTVMDYEVTSSITFVPVNIAHSLSTITSSFH